MKRGISLVALLITMVIMIALISTVTISGMATINNNKKVAFATEINMIQGAVDTYKLRNNNEYPIEAKIELDISKVTEKSIVQFSSENITDSKITLYKINYSMLGITSLRYGAGNDDNDMYAVSKETGKVYYTKGLKLGGFTYYTLTDDLKRIISGVNAEDYASDSIVFNTSETEWTLNKVVSKINVPVSFTNVSVSVLGSENLYSATLNDSLNVYTIDNVEGNYTIIVNYTKDGKEYSSEYTVDNVDNESPVFTKDNITENVTVNQDRTDIYLSLDGYYDKLSGIKTIKYAYLNMQNADEISNYFKNNGLKVYNDVIEIEELTKNMTIYIEDKVGNFTAIPYSISDDTYAKLLERDYVKDTDPTEVIKGMTYTAYIPAGFYYVGGNVSTGVVISDNIQDRNKGTSFDTASTLKGNQFVWVPINYIIAAQTLKSGISNFTNLRSMWAYNENASSVAEISEDFTEPYLDAQILEEAEYMEMLQSISKYGGFYIARYEAGTGDKGQLVSKKNVNVLNNIPWGTNIKDEGTAGAAYKAHQMYANVDSVESHLIYGTEWDAVMYWAVIEGKNVSNSASWGNYTNALQKTGSNDAYKTNNIFDIAGNVAELTMEAYSNTSRVVRGGAYNTAQGFAASLDYNVLANSSSNTVGFRVSMYLK